MLATQSQSRSREGRGLFHFDGTNWIRLNDEAISLAFDAEGKPWTIAGGNKLYDFESGVWKVQPRNLPDRVDFIDPLAITADGRTYSTGAIDNVAIELLEYGNDSAHFALSASTGPDNLYVRQLAASGTSLWVGHNGGLSSIDQTGTRNFSAFGIFIPRADGNGVYLLNSKNIQTLNDSVGPSFPLSSFPGSLIALAMDPQSRIWAATPNALHRLEGGKWKLQATLPFVVKNGIKMICIGSDGGVWVTTEQGIHKWDGNNWLSIPYPAPVQPDLPITNFTISGIQADRDGALWLSSRGLYKWEDGFWAVVDGPSAPYVRGFATDTSGAIWALGDSALYKILEPNGIRYPVPPVGGSYVTMVIDRFNRFWLTAAVPESGLWHFNGKTWMKFTTANSGLHSNRVSPLAAGPKSGDIWVASSSAISVLNQDGAAK